MKSFIALVASLFFMSSMALGQYGDDYEEPKPEYRICKIKAEISLERLYYSKAEALKFCRSLHDDFTRGCSVRQLGYGRGWGAFYSNEWIFEGKGRSWKRAKQLAFGKYAKFVDKFGWSKSYPHRVYFSRCSG